MALKTKEEELTLRQTRLAIKKISRKAVSNLLKKIRSTFELSDFDELKNRQSSRDFIELIPEVVDGQNSDVTVFIKSRTPNAKRIVIDSDATEIFPDELQLSQKCTFEKTDPELDQVTLRLAIMTNLEAIKTNVLKKLKRKNKKPCEKIDFHNSFSKIESKISEKQKQ